MANLPVTIQWHVTTQCGHRCQHCYMFDPATWPAERDDTLPLDGMVRVLDRMQEFEHGKSAPCRQRIVQAGK